MWCCWSSLASSILPSYFLFSQIKVRMRIDVCMRRRKSLLINMVVVIDVHLPFLSLPGPFSFFPSLSSSPISPFPSPSSPHHPSPPSLPLPGYPLLASCQDPLLQVLSKCPQVSLENSFRCCLDSLLGRSRVTVLLTVLFLLIEGNYTYAAKMARVSKIMK